MVIRDEQKQAMLQARAQTFEERIFAHLLKIWPEKCAERGEPAVRASIRAGIANAHKYDVDFEYDVGRYIDLMYATMDDFDTNPEIPEWVRTTLNDAELNGTQKMDILWERGKRELRLIAKLQGRDS